MADNVVQVHIQKVKFDHWGTTGVSEYFFDKIRLRYNSTETFDKTNWIKPKEMTLADEMENYFNNKTNDEFELF